MRGMSWFSPQTAALLLRLPGRGIDLSSPDEGPEEVLANLSRLDRQGFVVSRPGAPNPRTGRRLTVYDLSPKGLEFLRRTEAREAYLRRLMRALPASASQLTAVHTSPELPVRAVDAFMATLERRLWARAVRLVRVPGSRVESWLWELTSDGAEALAAGDQGLNPEALWAIGQRLAGQAREEARQLMREARGAA